MIYNDLLTKLTYLTKRNNLSNTEIGNIINVERRAMNGRAERNSKFKPTELELIENHYNIDLSSILINKNSLKRHFDDKIYSKNETIGNRINKIKIKNELSDVQMSVLLNISTEDFQKMLNGKLLPDLKFLNSIKENFEVSIDWLLYGD